MCVCLSREIQGAFEDAIQFSKHTSTVFCPLLYCPEMLGGFSLKARSFSCFCVIMGHKVRSSLLAVFSAADIPLFLWEHSVAFRGLKYCYWSDHFLFYVMIKPILYLETF